MASMELTDEYNEESFRTIVLVGSSEELRERRVACQKVLLEQLNVIPIEEWMFRVNTMHDLIAQTAVLICEAQMKEAGYGPPPVLIPLLCLAAVGGRRQRFGAIRIMA